MKVTDELIAEAKEYMRIRLGVSLFVMEMLDKPKEEIDEWFLEHVLKDPYSYETLKIKGIPLMGKGIKAIREEKGISRVDMALRIGINEATLKKYEEGTIYYIPYKILEAIRKELDCTKDYLAERNDNYDNPRSSKTISNTVIPSIN